MTGHGLLPDEQRETHPMVTSVNHRRPAGKSVLGARRPAGSPHENLATAFLTFTEAANSLERSYSQLQTEVARLHRELERANRELDQSLEENARVRTYLAGVLERLPCGVVASDASGEVKIVNPEARRLLDLPPGWPSGAGQVPEPVARLVASARSGGHTEHQHSFETRAGNRILGVVRQEIGGEAGAEAECIWILRDLTEQKRAAEEKEAARKSLALAEVATVLAHEIRNPLGSMELFTGLLADASAHLPETRQWITHLRAGLRVLSATVNNVLQFHGQASVHLLPAELGRLVRETMDFLQPMAQQRGQTIKVENRIGAAAVRADTNRLKQVFLNLSLNAFRAMPPGGTLTVRIGWAPECPGGAVRVDFADEGRGIEKVLLPRIFEPGFTTAHGSPGLGLSVSKKVVEQHHGEIEVHSKPQHGTTFSLTFPVCGESA